MVAEAEAQAQARAVATVGTAMVDAGWGSSDVACAGGGAVMAAATAPPAEPQAADSMVAAMMTEAGWTEGQAQVSSTPRGLTAAMHAAGGAPPSHAVPVDDQIGPYDLRPNPKREP